MLKLKELRKEKGVTQATVAKYLGISPQAYGFYETGKREPDIDTLEMLSDYFNVSVDYIIGIVNNKNEYIDISPTDVNFSRSDEAREKIVLMGYRYLDDTDKDIIFHQIWEMLKAEKYKDTDFTIKL